MSEFKKIATLAEVETLDPVETMAGYWHGVYGGAEPGSDRSRSYWHGWRNGYTDGGFAKPDEEQMQLLSELQARSMGALH